MISTDKHNNKDFTNKLYWHLSMKTCKCTSWKAGKTAF